MILDADMLEPGAVLEAELCIVGAGAAGIALALQFLRAPGRVVVIESGRLRPDAASQALYEGEVADPGLHPPLDTYRARRFGGSTALWGGRCIPLDPVDFRARPWIPHSGWPFGPEEIEPYYPAANALCEAGAYDYAARTAVPGGMRPLIAGFAPLDFSEDGIERFSAPTHFAARYRHRLDAAPRLRVVLGANCTGIDLAEGGGRVASLRLATLSGRKATLRAAQVVLATGGLEVPRLLLASRGPGAENGIGNARDMVGRYYMSHVAGTSGRLRLALPPRLIRHGYEVAEDGTYLRRRLQLTEAAQRREEAGNAILRLHFPRIPDPSHRSGVLSGLYLARFLLPYEYRKRLAEPDGAARPRLLPHLRNVARDPIAPLRFGWDMMLRRTLAARKFPSVIVRPPGGTYTIDYHGEQAPNPDSRVTLTNDTDALGLPRLRADWRVSEVDRHTARTAFRLLAADLRRWGRGTLDYDPDELMQDMLRDGAYGGHHLGTARLGTNPATSVVDPDGRVHGMENLWIAGGAVFPTSGQANPTLTIVALALRMADRLKEEMPSTLGGG